MELQEKITTALLSALEHTSQRQLAEKIGVSEATLINVKKQEWQLLSAGMQQKLKAYFRIDDWVLRKTRNFELISELCGDAKMNARFLAIAGYTGAGKTTALTHFAANNANVYYCLSTVMHTRNNLLMDIQKAMGISEGKNLYERMEAIVSRMNRTNALLIIDDAGKLSEACLKLIQVIYDRTENQAGIVMAGTEYLKTIIDKSANRDKQGFRELKRRIAYWQPMYRPSNTIVTHFAQAADIKDTGAIKWICDHAKDYGTLRNIIENAKRLNGNVSREILDSLHVGDNHYNDNRNG